MLGASLTGGLDQEVSRRNSEPAYGGASSAHGEPYLSQR